jgi:transposase
VPSSIIGRVFGIDKGIVKRHFKKFAKNADMQALNGRPPILTHAQQDQLFQAIAEAYTSGTPSTLADITSYVQRNFQVNIEKGTLSHMIHA